MIESHTQPGPAPDVYDLVRQFERTQGSSRAEALRAIQGMGAAGVDALLDRLHDEETRRNVRYRMSGLLVILSVVGIAGFGRIALKNPAMSLFVFACVGVWAVAMTWVGKGLRPSPWERAAKTVLACLYETLDNPRAAGPLLETYNDYVDENLNRWNALALTRLFSHYEKGDAASLKLKHRELLTRLLSQAANPPPARAGEALPDYRADFLVAALKVVGMLGSKEFLVPVERLAELTSETENLRRVQEAAQSCRTILRERAQKLESAS